MHVTMTWRQTQIGHSAKGRLRRQCASVHEPCPGSRGCRWRRSRRLGVRLLSSSTRSVGYADRARSLWSRLFARQLRVCFSQPRFAVGWSGRVMADAEDVVRPQLAGQGEVAVRSGDVALVLAVCRQMQPPRHDPGWTCDSLAPQFVAITLRRADEGNPHGCRVGALRLALRLSIAAR